MSVLVRGRNAWHSTWIMNYTRDAVLFTHVASAKNEAERRRGPGNVFYVYEAPAVVVRATNLDYVVADLHPDNPLGRYRGCRSANKGGALLPGSRVSDAIRSFGSLGYWNGHWSGAMLNEHSIVSGQVERFERLQQVGGKRLLNFKSFSQGAEWTLGWNARPTRYTRRGVNAVVRAFAGQVGAIPGYQAALDTARERWGSIDLTDNKVDLERRKWAWEPVLQSLAQVPRGGQE